MLAKQRFEVILRELNTNRAASVPHLCSLTGASEATIRRDLNTLARQGRLNKVHGGAVLTGSEFQVEEPDVGTKSLLHQPEKERIARCVLGKVVDLSCQKYSSNVIEKILLYAPESVRSEVVMELAECPNLRNILHHDVGDTVETL